MPNYPHGTPTWHHIPATSVSRAKEFYTKLLNLQYREPKSPEEAECIAHFMFPNPTLTEAEIGGGIMKVRENEKIADLYTKEGGLVAPTLYYSVDDLDMVMEKVEDWGGKVLAGKQGTGGEGEHAVIRDTEGNPVGIYWEGKKKA